MRLIDADELSEQYGLEAATKYGNKNAEQQTYSYSTMMMYEIADMIDDAPTVEAVPMSVIEDIKAEIEEIVQPDVIGGRANGKSIRYGMCKALEIINKHISGKGQE